MSPDRVIQLAPSSLALVLCRVDGVEEEKGCHGVQERGRQIFQDFQTANVRCFWNRRLVRAVSEVSFQGWLESWVLLIQGQSTDLEVLRDAWARRALRPPRGFIIRALGDLAPVQMNPVSQSQFIPLAEVLCCAISDMNTAQILVTQESLMEHLIKNYPGIATPSQDILYTTLGTLIKERKIYHTGEGYFIVTPQTYFITRKPAPDNKCVAAEDHSTSPPSITYLVSMESCADLTKGNVPSVSHCRSCSCFSEHPIHNIVGQQSINESTGKGHRNVKESKPLVQNQATSTSRDHYTCEKMKPQILLKEKEKCSKRFGISLFWRNASKKEKIRKEQATFSAQFPPEEWPVRDEDNLDNIPRDIEHEIIKRINPVLTVDNLMKHTLLMQKAEEQKKYFSKGTSTDIIKSRHGHNIRGSNRKKTGRLTKYHKKVQAGKEKNKKDACVIKSMVHSEKDMGSMSLHQTNEADDMTALESHCQVNVNPVHHDVIYKRQISNPFDGIPYRDYCNINGHKALKEMKRSSSGRQRRNVPRSRSLDCTRSKQVEDGTRCRNSERPLDTYDNEESFHEQIQTLIPDKDDLREYPPSYPQCSTLRIDDKFKQFKENNSVHCLCSEEESHVCDDFQKKMLVKTETIKENEGFKSFSKRTYGNRITTLDVSFQHTKPLHCKGAAVMKSAGMSHIGVSEQMETLQLCSYSASGLNDKDLPKYTVFKSLESRRLTDGSQTLHEKVVEDDACSSLYLEDDTEEIIEICPKLDTCGATMMDKNALKWNDTQTENTGTCANSQSHWNPKITFASTFASSVDHHQETYSPSVLSLDSSQEYQKSTLHTNQSLSQYVHDHPEAEATDCIHTSELADGSIFDYCNSSDGNSVAENLHISVNGNDETNITNSMQQSGEMRECFEHNIKLFNSNSNPLESNHNEKNENHSTTGDSGIESPRTRISLASNNSVILEKLKRRTLLQNVDVSGNAKSEGLLPANSLMQLTPAINV
ncbi:storkhead-box protein 1 [Rhinophrynus dorsalis]